MILKVKCKNLISTGVHTEHFTQRQNNIAVTGSASVKFLYT